MYSFHIHLHTIYPTHLRLSCWHESDRMNRCFVCWKDVGRGAAPLTEIINVDLAPSGSYSSSGSIWHHVYAGQGALCINHLHNTGKRTHINTLVKSLLSYSFTLPVFTLSSSLSNWKGSKVQTAGVNDRSIEGYIPLWASVMLSYRCGLFLLLSTWSEAIPAKHHLNSDSPSCAGSQQLLKTDVRSQYCCLSTGSEASLWQTMQGENCRSAPIKSSSAWK